MRLKYNDKHGYFTLDKTYYTANQKRKESYEGKLSAKYEKKFIARAEDRKVLTNVNTNELGNVPCNVQWSSSHRIAFDSTDSSTPNEFCVLFSAASAGKGAFKKYVRFM